MEPDYRRTSRRDNRDTSPQIINRNEPDAMGMKQSPVNSATRGNGHRNEYLISAKLIYQGLFQGPVPPADFQFNRDGQILNLRIPIKVNTILIKAKLCLLPAKALPVGICSHKAIQGRFMSMGHRTSSASRECGRGTRARMELAQRTKWLG